MEEADAHHPDASVLTAAKTTHEDASSTEEKKEHLGRVGEGVIHPTPISSAVVDPPQEASNNTEEL